ncbi:MAG TPA: bestrophin family ion channel [Ohtaekwangia sp.]
MFLKNKKSVGYIFWKCRWDILLIVLITVAISPVDNYVLNDTVFPLTIPSLLGTLLSLILAFRTGQAYDRWWEARKVWGSIVNNSRSLVRSAEGFSTGSEEGKQFVKDIALQQIAWTYALGQSLRGKNPIEGIDSYISATEVARLKGKANIPNALLQHQSQRIKAARDQNLITDFGQLRLDEIVRTNVDNMGMCERIKGTVFPSPYNLFLHITIYVFAVTLTIGITDFEGYIEIPSTIVISAIFLAIERVAVLLQDPFENNPSDIPVTTLAYKIEVDLKQMAGIDKPPQPVQANKFFQM